MRRIRLKFVIALALLVVSSAAGFVCRGWSGALIWPLLFCALIVVVGAALFVLRLVLSISFNMARLRGIRGRIGALSTEQLRELMQSPTHPDSQFALAELMRRGDAARPTKEQLFGMLTSGNPALCGHAMANLMVFYPELSLPAESSNLDSPELWRARVEELRRKG